MKVEKSSLCCWWRPMAEGSIWCAYHREAQERKAAEDLWELEFGPRARLEHDKGDED